MSNLGNMPPWAKRYVAASVQYASQRPPVIRSPSSDRCVIELSGGDLLVLYRDEDLRRRTSCYAQICTNYGVPVLNTQILTDQDDLRRYVSDHLKGRSKNKR